MHRFFVKPQAVCDGFIAVTGDDYKHLTKVLRIGEKEPIEICDGEGTDYTALIQEDDGATLQCRILSEQPSLGESDHEIILYQGLPKGQKLDEIIQKTVELGVAQIVPFTSERTVVKMGERAEKKTQRWQKIAYAAAKQSKRGRVPEICKPITFKALLAKAGEVDLFLVAYEDESHLGLKAALEANAKAKTVAVLIGPEGGLSPKEVAQLQELGAVSVSLGHRILRTETAGMAMISQINFFYEPMEYE